MHGRSAEDSIHASSIWEDVQKPPRSKWNTVRSTFLDAVPPSPSPGMRAALLLVQSLRRTDVLDFPTAESWISVKKKGRLGLDRRMSYLSHPVSMFHTRMITYFTKKTIEIHYSWHVSATGVSILHVQSSLAQIPRKLGGKAATNLQAVHGIGRNERQPKDTAWGYTQNDPKCGTIVYNNSSTCFCGVEPSICTFLRDFKGT